MTTSTSRVSKVSFALAVLFALFAGTTDIFAQEIVSKSAKKRPKWINDPPKGEFYIYSNGIGLGADLRQAQREAVANAMNNRAIEEQVQVRAKTEITTEDNNDEINKRIVDSIVLESESPILKGFGIEESYWEQEITDSGTRYRYWVLMRLPRDPSLPPPPPLTYGMRPLYQSAIIPGWGQYTKGSTYKAAIILSTFAGLGAYSAFANSQFKDWEQEFVDAGAAANLTARDIARENMDTWQSRRNLALIAFAGVYAFNLADALASKGEKLYASASKPGWQPILAANQVGFTYRF